MKKKVFNQTTIPVIRSSGYWISISPRSGTITFSGDLVRGIGADEKRLEFVQDEDRPRDWYLDVSNSKDALELREADGRYIYQSTFLAHQILSSLKADTSFSWRIPVASEATEENVFALLTAGAVKIIQNRKSKA